MTKQIIFYAPLGKGIPPEKIGGAEAGCLKTLHIYESAGYKVYCVEKAANKGNLFRFAISTLLVYLKLLLNCLLHPKAIVHIVGFYDKVIWIEWILIKTGKMLGHKVLYEMRNGGLVDIYSQRDNKYRQKQQDIWKAADGLLCQGQKFIDFIKSETGIEAFYYPNYIQDNFIKPNKFSNRKIEDGLNLIFFGRLVPAKNIDVIIETAAIVNNKYPGTTLHLIGGINDEYLSEMKSLMNKLHMPQNAVKFYGRLPFEKIAEILRRSHFFIFPSAEKNEGHSNSLTEAMGCGVVPIVSTAGFNESICGDPFLVVHDMDAICYADVITTMVSNNQWQLKSQQVYNRILNNYTESIVGRKLVQYIESI